MNPLNLLNLVKRHGSTLTLTKVATGTYSPSTGSVTNTETSYSVTGYMYHTKGAIMGESYTDALTSTGVKKVFIPSLGLSVAPAEGDNISGLGDKVKVRKVVTYYHQGKAVGYDCEVHE